MKFNKFLIQEIKRLKEEYNIKVLYPHSTHKDLNKRLKQIFKLTSFLDNEHITFRRISVRLYFVENNLHYLPKCKMCSNTINTFKAKFCSSKCQKKHFDLNETIENKEKRLKKAVQSRNYEEIHQKGHKTRKENDPDGKWIQKLKKSLNEKQENGLTVAQNRGKIFSENASDEMLKDRSLKAAKTRKEKDINSSKIFWDNISVDDRKNYNNKRLKSFRNSLIESGKMLPLEEQDGYKIYFSAAGFKHGFQFTNLTSDKEKHLLEENGVYNKTNTNGCVRDHLLSRRYGFENNIPTWIIGHPANCEIVLHSENVRRSNSNDNQITFEELMKRIKKYK